MITERAGREQPATRRAARYCLIGAFVALLVACAEEPPPRTFADFMEDRIAREGTLARCNANREATLYDIECASARRAAAAIALRQERDRREALEAESERKLAAMRDEVARRERAQREAEIAAEAAEKAAYEALWRASAAEAANGGVAAAPAQPNDGLGFVQLPSTVQTRGTESGSAEQQDPGLDEIAVPRPLRRDDAR
jgi:hypothetical protein